MSCGHLQAFVSISLAVCRNCHLHINLRSLFDRMEGQPTRTSIALRSVYASRPQSPEILLDTYHVERHPLRPARCARQWYKSHCNELMIAARLYEESCRNVLAWKIRRNGWQPKCLDLASITNSVGDIHSSGAVCQTSTWARTLARCAFT